MDWTHTVWLHNEVSGAESESEYAMLKKCFMKYRMLQMIPLKEADYSWTDLWHGGHGHLNMSLHQKHQIWWLTKWCHLSATWNVPIPPLQLSQMTNTCMEMDRNCIYRRNSQNEQELPVLTKAGSQLYAGCQIQARGQNNLYWQRTGTSVLWYKVSGITESLTQLLCNTSVFTEKVA